MSAPPLSVAILAPKAFLPNIQQGVESLGHFVQVAKDPSEMGSNPDLGNVDLVVVALTPEVEEIYDQLEELLDQAAATLFDEAENKQAWPAARWGQHLQPKLAKITPRQELEKLPLEPGAFELPASEEAAQSSAPIVLEDTAASGDDFAWDFVDLDSISESATPSPEADPMLPPVVMEPVAEAQAPAPEPSPVFDGGFDFYNDDEPSLLGSVTTEALPSLLEPTMPPVAPETAPEPAAAQGSVSPPSAAWDLSSLALVDDEAIAPPPAAPAPKPREVVLSGPQWSLEGEETDSPQEFGADPAPPPLLAQPEGPNETSPSPEAQEEPEAQMVADIPMDIPQLAEAPGMVLIGGGTGGPGALVQLMPHLPHGLPVPLVVHQPLPQGREEVFVANLQKHTQLPVQLVETEQRLTPGGVFVLRQGQSVEQTEDGCRVVAGELGDALSTLGEDSALVVLSGAPGAWVLPAMDAVGVGALLLGQNPEDALEPQTISTLSEIGLEIGTPEILGQRLAERWGLAAG